MNETHRSAVYGAYGIMLLAKGRSWRLECKYNEHTFGVRLFSLSI